MMSNNNQKKGHMITLHKLVPPENRTLFQRFPGLNEIWEVPALQHEARESYELWGDKSYEGETTGEIFSITRTIRRSALPAGLNTEIFPTCFACGITASCRAAVGDATERLR